MLCRSLLPLASLITLVQAARSNHVCSAPTLSAPTDGAIFRDTRVSINAAITDPVCSHILINYDGRVIGSQYGMTTSQPYTSSQVLTEGTHTVFATVEGFDANGDTVAQVSSAPITFTIALPTPCPAPTIQSPAAGSVLSTRDVTITGTFAATPACPNASTSGTAFSLAAQAWQNRSPNNVYTIRAIAKSASAAWKDSDYSASMQDFSVQIPQCATPLILTPTANTVQTGTMLSITGTFAGGSGCAYMNVYVNGADQGYVRTSGNTFSITSYVSGSGAYTIRAISRSTESSSLDSVSTAVDDRIVNVRVPCPIPFISVPTTQQSRTLAITGSVSQARTDCAIALFVDGVRVAQPTVQSDRTFAVTYVVATEGAHTVYAISTNNFGLEGNSQPSLTRTVTVLPPSPCPQPALGAPANNLEQHSKNIAISGAPSTRADCQVVDILVGGVVVGQATGTSSQFTYTHTVLTDGSYQVSAVFRSSVGPSLDSIPSALRTVIVDSSRCPLPVITSPLPNAAQNGGALTISGTAKGGSACPLVLLTLDGITPRAAVVTNGLWTYTFPSTSDGPHSVTAVNIFPPDRSYDSDTATVAVKSYLEPCPSPIMISPKAGETSTTSIFFSASVDSRPECGKLEIYMDGVLIYSSPTDAIVAPSRRKRAVQQVSFTVPTDNLPPGNHDIYAVTTGDNNGVRSPLIPIIIQNNGPVATGSFRRKRSTCSVWQTMCPFKANGRIGFECIDDIESSLERCGACDGPDCTEIPNASNVACVQSQCIVSTCLEGFTLEDNACVEATEGFTLQM